MKNKNTVDMVNSVMGHDIALTVYFFYIFRPLENRLTPLLRWHKFFSPFQKLNFLPWIKLSHYGLDHHMLRESEQGYNCAV